MAPLLLVLAMIAQSSPWWENYDSTESFLCPNRGRVVLERNASQASLISGGYRSTYFREPSQLPGIHYRNQSRSLILRGDILTLEQLPSRIECTRTEQV
ncbi:hypothetical protein [Cyanobium sp. NIES-981]|uniref:hypothetical protein n=1 Tax=Cyanobium sp. NIES-981 TaxID=1851505 RepID=UPI0007DCF9BC|nr:hypothetical protein [Cyanobium sp. NIES-981]SBO42415.1 conserved protein of unknown function [Cyanobium sp. NIES-981]